VEVLQRFVDKGNTVVVIEHNMDVVMNVSNRVLVLNAGKVLTIGTPEEVTSNEAVIEAYLGGGKKDA